MTQPLACPFCSAPRLGIDGSRHVYQCGTNIFIFEGRKAKAERSVKCVEASQRLAEETRRALTLVVQTWRDIPTLSDNQHLRTLDGKW